MLKSNYETFKGYAIFAGGIAGAAAVTYFTTIYLPARIIETATVATTTAMNASLPNVAYWIPGTIADTAAIAGAEAYGAAKSTGYVGTPAVLGSFTCGYTLGSNTVEYTFKGMEKLYQGVSVITDKAKSWVKKIDIPQQNNGVSTCAA